MKLATNEEELENARLQLDRFKRAVKKVNGCKK